MKALILLFLCFIQSRVTGSDLVGPRVVGGEPAPENDFPFVAAYYLDYGEDQSYQPYQCTGSIIDERWILTAAHCLPDPTLTKSFVSVGDLLARNETLRLPVETVYSHPKFKWTNRILWNDVGLIKLKEPLEWSPSVKPIRLGSIDPENDITVHYMGYGRNYEDDKRDYRDLNHILLTTVKYETCRVIHDQMSNIVERETQICAVNGMNKTLCFGDSGGPLIDLKRGRQVGVFSSLEDCSGKFPAIFARVSHFLPWIRSTTKLFTLGL